MAETRVAYIEKNQEKFIRELSEWLAIPSISALGEHDEDVYAASEWVRNKLVFLGFSEVRTIPTNGHPLIYTEWMVDEQQPTVLIYGHYDVQPVDPVSDWDTPPFEPQVRDGNIYGRGTSDDKGQIMVVIGALEAWLKTEGKLPVNVKILLEGEEESGGAGIERFVERNPELLKADAVLICDTHMVSETQPSLVQGLRGILYTEIAVSGARTDLHSGSYGGVAPNPIHALCVLISRLKGEDGVINIPELHEALGRPAAEEKAFWDADPLNIAESLKDEMGVDALVGEEDYPPLERLGVRPTLEVHGIRGGFTGEGAKTVIPARALAKVSMRLPAELDPYEVFGWFEKAVQKNLPAGHEATAVNMHSGRGVSVKAENPFFKAATDSLAETYQNRPVLMREGGSIPIAALFDSVLQAPIILMGFGLPDDGAHAANEKFSLTQLRLGMLTVADYLQRIRR
ncbi:MULTISPECIES: dipeptidase [Desulfosediminicola]|uniref:dipeptidase n=1 Tax=Desulfosediminicola TaxID=2886823 RepID=UPI0010AC7895|nr:dipeptidase [Desulfosediminicola ganghwensis]